MVGVGKFTTSHKEFCLIPLPVSESWSGNREFCRTEKKEVESSRMAFKRKQNYI
jgi:hypothetical protein